MKFFSFLGNFFKSLFKFLKTTFFICLIYAMVVFTLTIFFKENVENAIEIFKNLLQIP